MVGIKVEAPVDIKGPRDGTPSIGWYHGIIVTLQYGINTVLRRLIPLLKNLYTIAL